MNKRILITGANSGLGKDAARQLALIPETEKIYLACRNEDKAVTAKAALEAATGRDIFEIVVMDTSNPRSVRKAVAELDDVLDAVILNAGGLGGAQPAMKTEDGVTTIFASNVLGHAVLVEELLKSDKLKNVVLYASSEAVRGVKQMGMKPVNLKTSSEEEFASVFDGSYFGDNMDAMEAYALVKYGATLWMSSMARKHPDIRFISMSPGSTSGTAAMDSMTGFRKIMFKYIAMPIMLPLMGAVHKVEDGAKRYVDGINDKKYESGVFYASQNNKLVGPVVDQSPIFPDLKNISIQENASAAIHRFMN